MKALHMTIRITGLLQLVMGLAIWMGKAYPLILPHILIGLVMTIALFVITYQAYRAGISSWLVLLTAVWAIGLPAWGLAQNRILPGSLLWLSQVLHLLCGIGAIGLAEILGVKIRKKGD